MDNKKAIESHLNNILSAANSVEVSGEQNMAQLMGICRSAREVWRLINTLEKEAENDG